MSWYYPPATDLPSSPDDPLWGEVIDEIEHGDEEDSAADFRYWCHNSFWFFVRYCTTFGQFLCRDPHNEHYGKSWGDHPWVFDRCMELQEDPNGQWFKWPRGYFKSAIGTGYLSMWGGWIRDMPAVYNPKVIGTDMRILILTFKVEATGESFLYFVRSECTSNEKLKGHWPDLFYEKPADSGLWKSSALRIKQRTNPKEPSMLVHGLDNMPTSGHYDIIVMDDPVVRETVRNRRQIESTYSAMRQSTFLQDDNTVWRYFGTHWSAGDPWTLAQRDERFRVNHQDVYDAEGKPQLRSQEWLDETRRHSGRYDWWAQMRGNPTAASDQVFHVDWIEHYDNPPYKEREGKNVYILIDPARVNKDSCDYTAILVIGLGPDHYFYVLDLYRERYNLAEMTSVIFGLVSEWEPLCVFEEQYGAARDIEHIKWVQNEQKFRFRIKEIPHDKTVKEERIGGLQQAMEQRRFYFPRRFGHHPKDDDRDMMRIFLEEEYEHWTPESGSTLHDDMLDILAYTVRPYMKRLMKWPKKSQANIPEGSFNHGKRPKEREYSSWAAI